LTTGVAHANAAKVSSFLSALHFTTEGNLTPSMLEAGQSTSTWAWQSWAPNWTNFTVGNGTVVAKYIQIGKTVHFKIKVTLGSTSSVSGAITFSLPTDSHADYGTSGFNIGVSRMNDT